jgi:hypothetical protein
MKVLDRWAVYYPKERRATSAPLLTTHKKAAVSRTDWAVFVLGLASAVVFAWITERFGVTRSEKLGDPTQA